jgi:hypothetical protein
MTTARVLASLTGSLAIGLIINGYEPSFRPAPELLPVAGGDPAADCCADRSCEPTAPEPTAIPRAEFGRSAQQSCAAEGACTASRRLGESSLATSSLRCHKLPML